MESFLYLLIGFLGGGSLVVVIWLVIVLRLRNDGATETKKAASDQKGEKKEKKDSTAEREEDQASDEADTEFKFDQVYALAEELDDFVDRSAHPKDFLDREEFKKGVDMLRTSSLPDSELVSYGAGGNLGISCMALEALRLRESEEDPTEQILAILGRVRLWANYFAFKAVRPAQGRSLIGAVLTHLNTYWVDHLFMEAMLKEFIALRLEEGEVPSFKAYLNKPFEEKASKIERLLENLNIKELEPLQSELKEWQRLRVDVKALRGIGTVWDRDRPPEPIIEHPAMEHVLREVELSLLNSPKRSVLLIGDNGVGKTTLCTVFARRLQKEGWTIFEAGATEILAGQVYIGQLEERIQELIQNLGGNRKVLWIVPNFQQLVFAGWHRSDPRSILDMLLPILESGEMTVVGEIEPDAYDRLLQNKARMRTIMKGIQVSPMDNEETLALTRRWNILSHERDGTPLINAKVLEEAFHLARQFLDKAAAPGNLVGLLKWTQQNMLDPEKEMATNDAAP